jgi:ureidoacrylate peracid hydrolase
MSASPLVDWSPSNRTGVLLIDMQNDFLHPQGAYGQGGQSLPDAGGLMVRIRAVVDVARHANVPVFASRFTLVPGRDGQPLIAEHLRRLRPFLSAQHFVPGSWGHGVIDEMGTVDGVVDKVAYSAFAHTHLEWLLRKFGIDELLVGGIVTNGGVASTVRDAHVKEFHVTVLSDGCGAFSSDAHQANLAALHSVANVISCADAIAGLHRFAAAESAACTDSPTITGS